MNTAIPATATLRSSSSAVDTFSPFKVQHFECADVDQLAASMTGWQLTADQLSTGAFHGQLSEIRIDGLQLFHERINRIVLKRGAARDGALVFSVPIRTEGAAYCGDVALGGSELLISDGACLPELCTPVSHDIAVVALAADSLEKLSMLLRGTAFPSFHGTRVVALSAMRRAALSNCLSEAFSAARADERLTVYPQLRKSLHDSVVLDLATAASETHEVVRLDLATRRRIIDRVRELVLSQPDKPLTVLDLCVAVGASRRKLQYCFEEMLGTHPGHYVRALRLNAVRRELRVGSVGTTSVSDVAARWGFWHLSRFSAHYRELFGELPSHTLISPSR